MRGRQSAPKGVVALQSDGRWEQTIPLRSGESGGYAERLERGHLVWPQATSCQVVLSAVVDVALGY